MSTVRDPQKIDWLGLERGTDALLLTVIDDETWTNEREHLELLQAKLNAYLAFIESGEVYGAIEREVGRTPVAGMPIKVAILAKYALTESGRQFVDHARSLFKSAGFRLEHQQLTHRES